MTLILENEPSEYGIINYGENLYGAPATYGTTSAPALPAQLQVVPPQYVIEPFVAQALNYGSVGISWTKPSTSAVRWRLLANRYGYPVDQNDGNILLDSPAWIGTFYLDQAVIAGSYIYYGIYAQTNATTDTWVRCGVTGCLTVENAGSASWLLSHLPAYFTQYLDGSLTQDATGNNYLNQFSQVLGWGLDYVQGQYDMAFRHLNDPMAIPVNDLVNLATQLGLPFDPMISIYLMRQAAANWAHVTQERSTALGIANHMELLTGFDVDLQIGPNLMLDNDQSYFLDPIYPAWNIYTSYKVGEIVSYDNYLYSCLVAGPTSTGSGPTGVGTSNGYWQVLLDSDEPSGLLDNSATGGVGTWEVYYPTQLNGLGPADSLEEAIGRPSPSGGSAYQTNVLKLINQEGSAQDMYVRSVSRTTADQSAALNANFTFAQGVSPWTTGNGGTLGLATTWTAGASYPYSGTLTGNGTTANPSMYSERISVTPLTTYWLTTEMYSAAGWPTTQVGVNFYDVAGNYLASDTFLNFSVTSTATTQSANITTPADAFGVEIYVEMNGTPANTVILQIGYLKLCKPTPDKLQAINDGVPVPFTRPSQAWSPTVRYGTGDIVTYNWQPFQARRASTGATPPTGRNPSAEWNPLSPDQRLRLMVSGETLAGAGDSAVPIGVFVDWYDMWGNPITRVAARTPTAGTAGIPDNLAFDGFLLNPGSISGRAFDNSYATNWSVAAGGFTVSDYDGGVAYPTTAGVTSIALTTGPANGQVAVTLLSFASGGQTNGIVFRYSSGSYWFAGPSALWYYSGSAWTSEGTYSTAANAGDRLTVQMNGTGIEVFVNGSLVSSVTSSTNDTATQHGIGVVTT